MNNMKLISKKINFIASLIIGVCLFYYALKYFNINETIYAISRSRIGYLFAAFFLLIIAHLIRGKRWLIWEKNLTYGDSFKLILVGFMGNNILPARLGELLRAHCSAHRINRSFGRAGALASIVIERVLDGLVLAIVGILGSIFVPMDHRLLWALLFVCMFFLALTAGLLISISFHERIRNLMAKVNRIFPGRLTRFGKEKADYFLDGLLLIRGFRRISGALLVTVLIWGTELAIYYLIANAVSHDVPIGTCFVFLAAVNFASLFPFTVGGLGAIEGAATMYLVSAGIPAGESLAMVLILHGYQFFFTTILGALFYFTGRYYNIPLIQNRKTGAFNRSPTR